MSMSVKTNDPKKTCESRQQSRSHGNKESQQIFNRALGRLKPERASGRLPQGRAFTINRSLAK
jgi:hypothetical protein